MTNRVTACISRYETRIANLNGVGLNGQSLEVLEESQALAFQDFVGYQNAQAAAFASGKLTQEEAQTVYLALGGEAYQGDWPEGTPLATKIAITQLVGELLGIKRG